MKLSIIVAISDNNVIGNGNALPWRLSSDLKHFKSITMGKPIIMGRKTHESIGRPLPGRENIVLTRDKDYTAEGCRVIHDLDALSTLCNEYEELMIMGGAELYKQTLSLADRLYLTEVMAEVEGDVFFPEFDRNDWNEISREDHIADEKNEYDYRFLVLEKN